MAANARDLGLDKLPTEDKVALINELWADVVAEERSHPISPELARKIEERVASPRVPRNTRRAHQLQNSVLGVAILTFEDD